MLGDHTPTTLYSSGSRALRNLSIATLSVTGCRVLFLDIATFWWYGGMEQSIHLCSRGDSGLVGPLRNSVGTLPQYWLGTVYNAPRIAPRIPCGCRKRLPPPAADLIRPVWPPQKGVDGGFGPSPPHANPYGLRPAQRCVDRPGHHLLLCFSGSPSYIFVAKKQMRLYF